MIKAVITGDMIATSNVTITGQEPHEMAVEFEVVVAAAVNIKNTFLFSLYYR